MNNRFNKYKYPGAKRLMLEAQELRREETEYYCAQPIDDNLFEWHFTVRGPPDTAFEGGYYHGRLSFPTEYPMKPPSIILLTPNGRFSINKKICLSISGYHPETWQPSWSVRTALLALIAFMPTKTYGAIGSLNYPDDRRRHLALQSHKWRCESCGLIKDLLKQPQESNKYDDTIDAGLPNNSSSLCSSNDSQSISTSHKVNRSGAVEATGKNPDTNKDLQSTSTKGTREGSLLIDSSESISHPPEQTESIAQLITTNSDLKQKGKSTDAEVTTLIDNSTEQDSETPASETVVQDERQSINSPIHDNRRNYPTLAYASIFILLFLLLLRRLVMLVQ